MVKSKMKANIKADIEKISTKFVVDESVTDWLMASTDMIFDIIQKAIQENRFEIVESGLNNIKNLAKEYIEARKDYSSEQDNFLIFTDEKLIDAKNLVQKNTHPKIMLSIARTAKAIAIETLQIKTLRRFAGENYMPLGFINLLSDICSSSEVLKDTSYAPMSAIDYLVEIAKVSIDSGYPRTAKLISDKLGYIATFNTELHFLYGDSIAGRANWGLVVILDHMLRSQGKLSLHIKHEVKSVLDEIDKSISVYMKDDIKYHYPLRNNIKTFFGSFAERGLASIYIKALQKKTSGQFLNLTLETLEDLIKNLNQNVMQGMSNSKYLDVLDILENIYVIGIVLVGVAKESKDPRFQVEMVSMLQERFYLPYKNALLGSFKRDNNRYIIPDDSYMHVFFSLIGVIFYENRGEVFSDVLETWASELVKIIQRYKTQVTTTHDGRTFERSEITGVLSDLYKNLRLLGAWFNYFLPKSTILNTVIYELKSQPTATIQHEEYDKRSYYPKDFIAQRWIVLRPYLPYSPKYFVDLDNALFNDKVIDKFDKKLSQPTKE